ncbi:MAG: pyridoxamine 5'-phosphate oxidase family protein [Bacteroidia bacterium]|nr:pyridoxamine 5'-phosphate oxidase family protein [Bacteroidia bacterium]
MSHSYLKNIFNSLRKAVEKKSHPFRIFTLGTVGLDRMARLRTVVLRGVTADQELLFYTDRRSKKVTHMKENNKVGMLFYDQENKIQLKVEGVASLIKDEETLAGYWQGIAEVNRKDYTSTTPPGSIVKHPDDVEYLKDKDYFSAVKVTLFKLEYLQLQPVSHIKIRFSKQEGSWVSEYLVP